jgi:hypothetical protein
MNLSPSTGLGVALPPAASNATVQTEPVCAGVFVVRAVRANEPAKRITGRRTGAYPWQGVAGPRTGREYCEP